MRVERLLRVKDIRWKAVKRKRFLEGPGSQGPFIKKILKKILILTPSY